MIITAKFPSLCPVCSLRVRAGDRVEWERGEKARHLECVSPQETAARAPESGVVPSSVPAAIAPITRMAPLGMLEDVARTNPASEPDSWQALAEALAASVEAERESDRRVESAPILEAVKAVVPVAPILALAPYWTRLARSSKLPRQYVQRATDEDLAWDPEARELFTLNDTSDEVTRAGTSVAVCRPGLERWPLGVASKKYRTWSHRKADETTLSACTGQVTKTRSYIVGQGTRIVHEYSLDTIQSDQIAGAEVTTRLTVVVPHTGKEKLRASMVLYVGDDAIGCLVHASASHVASNPELWQSDVAGMVNEAGLAQVAVLDLLRAASGHVLTGEDRRWFGRKGIKIKNSSHTALDAMRAWHKGVKKTTWGVWSRRLDSEAIRTLVLFFESKGFVSVTKTVRELLGWPIPRAA